MVIVLSLPTVSERALRCRVWPDLLLNNLMWLPSFTHDIQYDNRKRRPKTETGTPNTHAGGIPICRRCGGEKNARCREERKADQIGI